MKLFQEIRRFVSRNTHLLLAIQFVFDKPAFCKLSVARNVDITINKLDFWPKQRLQKRRENVFFSQKQLRAAENHVKEISRTRLQLLFRWNNRLLFILVFWRPPKRVELSNENF